MSIYVSGFADKRPETTQLETGQANTIDLGDALNLELSRKKHSKLQ